MARRRKKPGMRGLDHKRLTPEEEDEQREAAFAAIRLLYRDALPLWQVCPRAPCKRHRRCCGEVRPCLERGWPLLPAAVQDAAYEEVQRGGPRRLPPATHTEWELRRFPPSNFVH